MKDRVILVVSEAKDEKQAEADRRAVMKVLEAWLRAVEEAEKKEAEKKS